MNDQLTDLFLNLSPTTLAAIITDLRNAAHEYKAQDDLRNLIKTDSMIKVAQRALAMAQPA